MRKQSRSFTLSDKVAEKLDKEAWKKRISRSQYVEDHFRELFKLDKKRKGD